MPIRVRLTSVCAAASVLLAVVGGASFVLALRAGLVHNLDAALETRAGDALAQLASSPEAVATESTNGISVQVLAADGTVVDGSDALFGRPVLTAAQVRAVSGSPLRADATVPVASAHDTGSVDARIVAIRYPSGVVVAVASRDTITATISRAELELVVAGTVLVLATTAGSWLLARAALRPVDAMRRQAADARVGDLAPPFAPRGRDELARLAVTLNDLTTRWQEATAREQTFVADAGHELRTPLTVLRGELELARRPGRTREEIEKAIDVATSETHRLARLADDLLTLASGDVVRTPAETDLAEVARDACASLAPAFAAAGVSANLRCDRSVRVLGDGLDLRRAVDNLLTNALRHAPAMSSVDVVVRREEPDGGGGGYGVVSIRDHGPGVPDAFLPHAFERFAQADRSRARTRPGGVGGGSGLGLAIVRRVTDRHDGSVSLDNHVDGGAVAELRIPVR